MAYLDTAFITARDARAWPLAAAYSTVLQVLKFYRGISVDSAYRIAAKWQTAEANDPNQPSMAPFNREVVQCIRSIYKRFQVEAGVELVTKN